MISSLERILLTLYFPQFKSPSCSRFESLFQTISQKELSSKKKKKNKSRIICPEKIVRNEDKRTSIIIKGIPSDIPKKDVRNLIEKYGNVNYLYVTKDLSNDEENTSIAFINVINYKTIIPLFMNMRNYKFNSNEKLYSIKIMYASAQGKKQLKHYVKQEYSYEYFE